MVEMVETPSQVAPVGKNPPADAGDRREEGHPWVGKIPPRWKWQPAPLFLLENPMDRGTWWATCGHGATVSQTDWLTSSRRGDCQTPWSFPWRCVYHCKTPVLPAGRGSYWQRLSLAYILTSVPTLWNKEQNESRGSTCPLQELSQRECVQAEP